MTVPLRSRFVSPRPQCCNSEGLVETKMFPLGPRLNSKRFRGVKKERRVCSRSILRAGKTMNIPFFALYLSHGNACNAGYLVPVIKWLSELSEDDKEVDHQFK